MTFSCNIMCGLREADLHGARTLAPPDAYFFFVELPHQGRGPQKRCSHRSDEFNLQRTTQQEDYRGVYHEGGQRRM